MAGLLRDPDPGRARTGNELRIRPATIGLAVVLGIFIGCAVDVARSGSLTFWLARHGLATPYADHGRRVDIGGRSMWIDCRGEGGATVVFEAGAGGTGRDWGTVFPEVAGFTRACVYDRAGLGRSDPDPRPIRTGATVADDLAALLSAAGESPPFVLVGHSLGGAYARVFADRHRQDASGIVLDDAFNPDLFPAQVAAAPPDLQDAWLADMDATFALVERVEGIDWPSTADELASVDLGDLPVEALIADHRDPRLTDEQAAAVEAARLTALDTMSGDVRVTFAEGADHFIHLTRPDLVVGSILRLVNG